MVKCLLLAALPLCSIAVGNSFAAASRDEEIVASALREVEWVCKKYKTLETVGKSTLSQSSLILDLGEPAAPVLAKAVRDKRKDWKLRFWTADMLGYVGNVRSMDVLLKVAGDSKEKKQIRLRACDSLYEIAARHKAGLDKKKTRSKLLRASKQSRDPEIRLKIKKVLGLLP